MTPIVLTAFGPFPGAPVNPTGSIVRAIARRLRKDDAERDVTTVVFKTSYATVDRRLPALLDKRRPDVLILFGLATSAKHIRIETQARNALSRTVEDAAGQLAGRARIEPGAPARVPGRAPMQTLGDAARAAGAPCRLSRNAGDYLCNYAYWRALALTPKRRGPLVVFIHVPPLAVLGRKDSVRACEAAVRAAIRSRAKPRRA